MYAPAYYRDTAVANHCRWGKHTALSESAVIFRELPDIEQWPLKWLWADHCKKIKEMSIFFFTSTILSLIAGHIQDRTPSLVATQRREYCQNTFSYKYFCSVLGSSQKDFLYIHGSWEVRCLLSQSMFLHNNYIQQAKVFLTTSTQKSPFGFKFYRDKDLLIENGKKYKIKSAKILLPGPRNKEKKNK